MRRFLRSAIASLGLWSVAASPTLAAAWPDYPMENGWSGPGFYLSLFKVIFSWVIFVFWVRTADWVNRDLEEHSLNYLRWNSIVFGTFMASFVLLWMIPIFWVGMPLILLASFVPALVYVFDRNKQVEDELRVLTPDHIRRWTAARLAFAGVKVEEPGADPHESGPPVVLKAYGGDSKRDDNVNLLTARQLPGFGDARFLLADGLYRRATGVMLDFSSEAVGIRYMVDGVWHGGESMDREMGDGILESLKSLCGLDPENRKGRQSGKFLVKFESAGYDATLTTQTTKTGERMVVQLEDKESKFDTFEEIGIRPKMEERVREMMATKQGLVLLAAPPAAGLRTTTSVLIHRTDRFTREFVAVEEESRRYESIENVPIKTYNKAGGETQLEILRKVFLNEPEVAIVRDCDGPETVELLCREVAKKRLIISTVRAKEAAEALLKVMGPKVSPKEFSKAMAAVFCQRLVRLLCEECKEAYAPPPKVLKQLGIPEGRVEAFYRPPQEPEEICHACDGVGYLGQTAVFELLMVDDAVRKALAQNVSLEVLRKTARQAGMKTFQEEGLVLVAKGTTSLPELMRVLKQ